MLIMTCYVSEIKLNHFFYDHIRTARMVVLNVKTSIYSFQMQLV